jgi:hypothetical protein
MRHLVSIPLASLRWSIISLMLLFSFTALSQDKTDSTEAKKISLTKKGINMGMDAITKSNADTVVNESGIAANVEYEGKIVRHIILQSIDLKRSIYDSTKRTKKFITDIADALHGSTRPSIIHNHIFIDKNKPLNPYQVADNERYIRDLDFILDCRFVVTPVPGTDSVDVTVVTRDVFSLGVRIGGSIPTAPRIGVYDANLFGRGQRTEVNALLDPTRDPPVGVSLFYRKSSIFGSLASFEIGYSELNTNRSYGEENEYAYYVRLNRPLVSPYSRMAGGIELSRNWSENVWDDPDSVFLKYNYRVVDTWLGYNIGIKKAFHKRNRHFLSLRYFDGQYFDQPEQEEYKEERTYNSAVGLLGQYTFYWQNLYKTRYVFGFGRTEDIPYGMSWSITGGQFKQLGLNRLYTSTAFQRSFANRKGNFYTFKAEGGGYLGSGTLEDAVVTTSLTYVTRALNLKRYKFRGFLQGGYAQLFNERIANPIEINDSEVNNFSADSLWGDTKLFARLQTVLYTPWQLFGFRFAVFAAVDRVWLECTTCGDLKVTGARVGVTGFSLGFRTRNENLIFGTMEVRGTFIPATDATSSKFSFEFKQRLKVKNSGTFVKPPTLIRY